jgi:hypothetical protein
MTANETNSRDIENLTHRCVIYSTTVCNTLAYVKAYS